MGKNQRSGVIRLCIGILCVLCCIGILCIRLLVNVFPVSISSPKIGIEQPLGAGEAIAFSYMRIDMLRPFELYLLDDTNGIRSISHGLVRSDVSPIWSPDGTQIVYESVSGRAVRYYLADADGANRREITPDDSYKALRRWSPDGSRLAYLTYYQQSNGSTSNATSLCVTEIATGDTYQAQAGNIQDFVWMPDGQSLLAIERIDDLVSVEAYDADGDHERRIYETEFLYDAVDITISPDASRVAYIIPDKDEDIESSTESLYISALDGSSMQAVDVRWTEGSIVWSPDSTKIAFVALTNDYEYALYVVDADGTDLQELMLLNVGDESGEILPAAPAWSPDSAHIAISSHFTSDGSAIFVMKPDGTERRQVTTIASGGMIYDVAWRPRQQ
jgi:Tol biopolymer transport system component